MSIQKEKVFILHWIGGKTERVTGKTISEAFSNAGYGAGAFRALDWWEEQKRRGVEPYRDWREGRETT